MRINQPVTGNEHSLRDDHIIVSRTDIGGRIQFINKDFIETSGFTKEELLEQPQNIVRHPDMPSEVFEDMWRDLKAGLPWSGYFKNRCKNGDHYWVNANTTPIFENGVATGYSSILIKPKSGIIAQIEPVYRLFKESKAKGLYIKHGRILSDSKKAQVGRTWEKLGAKIAVISVILCILTLLVGVVGLSQIGLLPIFIAFLVQFFFVIFSSSYLKKSVKSKIEYLGSCLNSIVGGNLTTEIEVKDDEFVGIMTTLKAMQAKLAYAEYEKKQIECEKHDLQEKLANDFEQSVKAIVNIVASAATELSQTAHDMVSMINGSSQKAGDATSAATLTTANVQTVAAAAEELSASVREISGQFQKTTQLVVRSGEKANNADFLANALTKSSDKVSQAMEMISTIAGQINLLALNATIESARAGEAGKGFAVVASEVKNLAGQSDRSVVEIQSVVAEMRTASQAIIAALNEIKSSVNAISEATSSVASAVEEQSATTNEIARSMQTAAEGTQTISSNLQDVSKSSTQAGAAAEQMFQASQELSKQAESLNSHVDAFLVKIRAS